MENVILVVDPFPESFISALNETGAKVIYEPALDREEVLARLALTDILIINSRIKLDADAIAAAPRLRLVCRAGVGLDHFDLQTLQARGIRVFSTPGANAIPVAEQTVGMLLAMLHHICTANQEVRSGSWLREQNRGTEIYGKTVGIIGYGNTGSRVAERLLSFGCRILVYDKYRQGFGNEKIIECDWHTIQQEADILTLHVPLTPETHHLVNSQMVEGFHRPFWLLNLSRGPVVDTNALVEGLESGKIRGAALDVLENERPDTWNSQERGLMARLFVFRDAIFTPHIGGWSHESLVRINELILSEVKAMIKQMQG